MDRTKLMNEIVKIGPKDKDLFELLKFVRDMDLIVIAQNLGIDTDKLLEVQS